MQYKEELDLLRQQIPIGIRHGLNLLTKSNGDINHARRLFENEMIEVVIAKTSVSPEIAEKHLLAFEYDVAKALASIDEERFTLSERILQKTKGNKERALDLIGGNMEDAKKLKRNYWLKLDELEGLSPVQYCLLVVKEWLDYEDYEGFDYAIYFYADIAAYQIETRLLLPEVADYLREGRRRSDEILALHKSPKAIKKPFLLGNVLNEDERFMKNENAFRKARTLIIDRLYSMVVDNIGQFD